MNPMLVPGQPAPWFHAVALEGNPRFAFDTMAGRWIVVLLLGSGAPEGPQAALQVLQENRDLFDDKTACFFGVTIDPTDVKTGRIAQQVPGVRWFLDYDRAISTQYGAARPQGNGISYTPHWLLLDPMLRVNNTAPVHGGGEIMAQLRRAVGKPPVDMTAPVLVIPEVLSRDTCRRLIAAYDRNGGTESGFMREENGVTIQKLDHHHKRRADYMIEDGDLVAELKNRLSVALRPILRRAFQSDANRVERWLVACYDGASGGHFRAHRDNTTKGTAHRKFACTINLNAEEYEGGDLWFPEFGQRTYRAPTGGAVVFSCSLLHEARPVTRGRRYALLPFLYDDEGARLRERNLAFVAPELQSYRSGLPPEGA